MESAPRRRFHSAAMITSSVAALKKPSKSSWRRNPQTATARPSPARWPRPIMASASKRHRFHLPFKPGVRAQAPIPFSGYDHLLSRRFEEAIEIFLAAQSANGDSAAISSALAAAYHGLGFQTLAGQVRRSVRTVRGNQWMFRTGHPADYPLRLRPELLNQTGGLFP